MCYTLTLSHKYKMATSTVALLYATIGESHTDNKYIYVKYSLTLLVSVSTT